MLFGEFSRRRPVEEAEAAEAGRVVALGDDVFGDAHVADRADGMAVLRDARDAAGKGGGGRPAADRHALHGHGPRAGARTPDSRPASAAWPLPETPASPVISPLCSVSVTRSSGVPWRGARGRDVFEDRAAPGRYDRRPRAAARPPGRPSVRRVRWRSSRRSGVRRPACPAQHQHAVADRHHLVELVRDEDDRQPLPRPAASACANSASVSGGVSTAVGSSRMRIRASR